jgi:hypothetical protein
MYIYIYIYMYVFVPQKLHLQFRNAVSFYITHTKAIQKMQYTYINVTLRRVRATNVVVEKLYVLLILSVCL